jgi:hypothetical protein
VVGKRGLEPRLPAPRAGALTLYTTSRSGWTDSNRRPHAPRAYALPAAPQPVTSRRDPRSRTAILLNPNQADYRLPRSRRWTAGDSNSVSLPCGGSALPDELAARDHRGTGAIRTRGLLRAMQTLCQTELQPHRRRGDAVAAVSGRRGWPAAYGAHAMDLSISKHVHPWVVLRRDRRSRTCIPLGLEPSRPAAG